jgi:hypothetical protein
MGGRSTLTTPRTTLLTAWCPKHYQHCETTNIARLPTYSADYCRRDHKLMWSSMSHDDQRAQLWT